MKRPKERTDSIIRFVEVCGLIVVIEFVCDMYFVSWLLVLVWLFMFEIQRGC